MGLGKKSAWRENKLWNAESASVECSLGLDVLAGTNPNIDVEISSASWQSVVLLHCAHHDLGVVGAWFV